MDSGQVDSPPRNTHQIQILAQVDSQREIGELGTILQEFLTKIKPKQKKVFSELRSAIVALPETQESLEIDEFSGDWCPAYRVRGGDLVWVHLLDRLWVHIPIEPEFEKKVLQEESLDSVVVERVKDADEIGDVKVAKLEVKSTNEIEQIMPLVKLRHTTLIT